MDRSKFRDTTKVSSLKAQDEKLNATLGINNGGGKGDYAKFHTVDKGKNKFRIYPPHPNEKENPFIEAVQRWWLPLDVEEKNEKGEVIKDKKGNPKMKRTRKPVFDARIHSKVGQDIVAEYIAFLEKKLSDDGLDAEEISEAMLPIYGSYARKIQGILGKPAWVMYADKISGENMTFGRLEVGKAVKIGINNACAIESSDEPLGTESSNPFTDLDEGRAMVIDYNPESTTPTGYYAVSVDSELIKGSGGRVKLYSLTDEQLEAFMGYPSLADLYQDSYTTRDFELALEGLRNVDEDNDFGVFEYEDFLKIAERLSKAYPQPKNKESKREDDEEEEEGEISLDKMDRKQLKTYIKENSLSITVIQSMSDDDIREAIINLQSDVEEEEEEEDEPELKEKYGISKVSAKKSSVEQEDEEPTNDLPWEKEELKLSDSQPKSGSHVDRLAEMRARLKK